MAKKRRKPAKKLSAAEKLKRRQQRQLYREFRNFMRELGFRQIKADGTEIRVDGRPGELDDIFIYENIILLVEYTTGEPDSSHILKKKPFFDKILNNPSHFLDVAKKSYPDLQSALPQIYDDNHYRLKILYVPLKEASDSTRDTCPEIIFLQGGVRKYFYALGKTIQRSAQVEFFHFLDLSWGSIGQGVLSSTRQTHTYNGQLLPDSMSSFPKGYRVVSFYADPESLITGAYVLRRDGWRDSAHLYQRILVRNKISKMRRYLADQTRVFVNNVIVTLPQKTRIEDNSLSGDLSTEKARPVSISLPVEYSTIGIIDGQHRVFCYHEGDDTHEAKISLLRKKQHLLVTGIIFPEKISDQAKLEFEARLFLEINDTQTRARPALRQDIETIVRPFSGIAVARRVMAALAKKGPYAGLFQLGYFDSPSKIKTSSIVSYGLRPIVKFDGNDSLFHAWGNSDKHKLKERERKAAKDSNYESDLDLLDEYISFCVKSLNDFFLTAKLSYGTQNWDTEDQSPSPLLRPTSINGLIACLRRIIENDMPLSIEAHEKRMQTFRTFDFASYKSSQWNALGEALFSHHYNKGRS